jgi:hypothetical protein
MQQRHLLLKEGELYLVVGLLLGRAEGLDTLRMGLATMIEPPHLLFVGLEESPLAEGGDSSQGVALVQEFVAGDGVLGEGGGILEEGGGVLEECGGWSVE